MQMNELVLFQHAEGAATHWELRETAVRAPHFSLRTLAILEGRLEGNIDGLRIGERAGSPFSPGAVRLDEPGEAFVASVLALESKDAWRVDQLVSAVTTAPALARALASALGWLPSSVALHYVGSLLKAQQSLTRAAAVAAYAIHRSDPAHDVDERVEDSDGLVRARARRAAGELGRQDLVPLLAYGLTDADELCRFWSAFSLTLLGDKRGLAVIRATAEKDTMLAERAAMLSARAMTPSEAASWQRELSSNIERRRIAVQVAGAIGDPALIPWLIDQMSVPALARAAGGAFTTITGVDLAYHDLEGAPPSGFETGPNDDAADDNVAMDPDENVPFPDPRLVGDWWVRNRHSCSPGVRHLTGKPITKASLEDVLRMGRQRQRGAAALELTLLEPGRPLFEIRAPAARQRALLGI
jgi:uncharacterized protein (TIGR02270 family)